MSYVIYCFIVLVSLVCVRACVSYQRAVPCNALVWWIRLKGTVHPKMKILSSFTHPQLVPNLYECLCSAEHKGRYSEECGKQSSSGAPLTSIVFSFPTMEVNDAPKQPGYKLSSKYLPLCSAEQRNSYRFRTTWGEDSFLGELSL